MPFSNTFLLALFAALVFAIAVLISGSGNASNKSTPTISASFSRMLRHQAEATTAPTPTETTTTTTLAAPPTPSYPVVQFTYEKVWPFTAQIASVTENPNGFPGGGLVPPPHHTILMVKVNITSQISGRTVPLPRFKLVCSEPGVQFGPSGLYGYDGGSEAAPDSTGSSIALGDGQPHAWDSEWEVPEGTSTASVVCQLEEPTTYAPVVQNLN